MARVAGERVAQREVKKGHEGEDSERFKRGVIEHRARFSELHEANDGSQRRTFYHLY